ncbi:hypothetical protein Tco_0374922 [Tanacetum coccineum]
MVRTSSKATKRRNRRSSLSNIQEEITMALKEGILEDEIMFSTHQAAKFQEDEFGLSENQNPYQQTNSVRSPTSNNPPGTPLRSFIFGVKAKKQKLSIFNGVCEGGKTVVAVVDGSGRVCTGHNIFRLDCVGLMEAYTWVSRPPHNPRKINVYQRWKKSLITLPFEKFRKPMLGSKELFKSTLTKVAYASKLINDLHLSGNVCPGHTRIMRQGTKKELFAIATVDHGHVTEKHIMILAIGYVVMTTTSVKLDTRMKALRVMDTQRSTKMMVAHHHHLNLLFSCAEQSERIGGFYRKDEILSGIIYKGESFHVAIIEFVVDVDNAVVDVIDQMISCEDLDVYDRNAEIGRRIYPYP